MAVEFLPFKRVNSRRWNVIALVCLILTASKAEVLADNLLTINLVEKSNNTLVATGSGNIDLTDLQFDSSEGTFVLEEPAFGRFLVGPSSGGTVDVYRGLTGPSSYGTTADTIAPLLGGSGDEFGISQTGDVLVPKGYTSGAPLFGTASFDGNFAFLGITPGIYTYNYGSGADAGQIILVAPEPSTYALMGLGLLALVGIRRFRRLSA